MKIQDKYVINNIKKETLKNLSIYGVKGWNMTKLAADSGIAKDTLYRIIGSKEELIKEVLIERIIASKEKLNNIMSSDIAYIDKFEPIIYELADFCLELSMQNIQEILLAFPSIEKEVSTTKNEQDNSILEFIQAGINNGFLKPDVDPQVLLNIINANLIYFSKYSDKAEVKKQIITSLKYILGGVANEKVHSI